MTPDSKQAVQTDVHVLFSFLFRIRKCHQSLRRAVPWVNYPFNNAQVTETQLSKRQPRVQKVKGAPELKFSLVTMHGALVSPTVAPTPSPAPPLARGEGGLHSFAWKLFTVAATDSPPLTHSTLSPSSSLLRSPF